MKLDDRTIRMEINRLCDEYEDLWIAGQTPQIDQFLKTEFPKEYLTELFEHLLELDLHYQSLKGVTPDFDQLSHQFPEFASIVDRLCRREQLDPSIRKPPLDTKAKHDLDTSTGHTDSLATGSESLESKLKTGFGRYKIIQKIGQGGMGSVFLAQDQTLERKVAIKIPDIEAGNKELVDRFAREATTAAALHHRNICPIFDTGKQDGILFISMAFIEGQSLAEWIKDEKPLNPLTIADLINKMALALEHAHQNGIIHRDLKPSNIMIDCSGEPVLMDFGLARRETMTESAMLTQSGTIIGTPAYMSPEQVRRGDTVNRLADIYSLGVILYRLLCGALPFQGSLMSVLSQIHLEEPAAPRKIDPQVDSQLERICLRAMSKSPADRFQSMQEFSDELTDYLTAQKTTNSTAGKQLVIPRLVDVDESMKTLSPAMIDWSPNDIPRANVAAKQGQGVTKADGKRNRLIQWLVALSLAFGIILTGIILMIPAKDGFIRVEILDPEIVAQIQSNGLKINFKDQSESIQVKAGEEQFLILTRGDEEFHTDRFVLNRGNETRLKINFIKGELVAFRDGEPLGLKELDPKKPIAKKPNSTKPSNTSNQSIQQKKVELVRDLPFYDCLVYENQVGMTDGRDFVALPRDRFEEIRSRIDHVFTIGLTREKLKMVLDTFPNLFYLRIREPKFTAADYELISRTNLRQLAVHPPFGDSLPDDHVAAIGQLTQLTSLALDGVSDDELRHLKRMDNLKSLILHECSFEGNGFQCIRALKNLEKLNVGFAIPGPQNTILRQVSNMPSLRVLIFPATDDLDITLIRKLPKLQTLAFNSYERQVEIPDITPLLDLKDLRILVLPYLHKQHFNVLNDMKWLETINELPREAFLTNQKRLSKEE